MRFLKTSEKNTMDLNEAQQEFKLRISSHLSFLNCLELTSIINW